MKKTKSLSIAVLFLVSAVSIFGREARLVRYPHYHNGKIVFTYFGDIWSADENGQNIQRLTVIALAMFILDSRQMESGSLSPVTEMATSTCSSFLLPAAHRSS